MLDPSELLEAARQPLRAGLVDPPSQAELRRSVSTAYYVVFHTLARAGADLFVGADKRESAAYALIYRSFNHGRIKSVCAMLQSPTLNKSVQQQLDRDSISGAARNFANNFLSSQEARHLADYDPREEFRVSKAVDQIAITEAAIADFAAIPSDEKIDILALMLANPRG